MRNPEDFAVAVKLTLLLVLLGPVGFQILKYIVREDAPAPSVTAHAAAVTVHSTFPDVQPDDMPFAPHEYRRDLAIMLNMLRATHPPCTRSIELDSARLADLVSPDPVNPEFLVRCNGGQTIVRFTWQDVLNRSLPAQRRGIEQRAATDLCEAAVTRQASRPDSVKFSRVWSLSFRDNGGGTAQVETTFKAKNAFDAELEHRVRCEFSGGSLVNTVIAQL